MECRNLCLGGSDGGEARLVSPSHKRAIFSDLGLRIPAVPAMLLARLINSKIKLQDFFAESVTNLYSAMPSVVRNDMAQTLHDD